MKLWLWPVAHGHERRRFGGKSAHVKKAARHRAVGGDLGFQGIEAVEFLLGSKVIHQRHPQMAGVEIAFEIEQMNFQQHILLIEGRPVAEIGDAAMPNGAGTAIDPGSYGIDALLRM